MGYLDAPRGTGLPALVERWFGTLAGKVSALFDRVRALDEAEVTVVASGTFSMTNENVIEYTGGSGGKIVLPPANAITGRRSRPRIIMNSGSVFVTVVPTGSDRLNGRSTTFLQPQDMGVFVSNGLDTWRMDVPRRTADHALGQGGFEEFVQIIASADTSVNAVAHTYDYAIDNAGHNCPGDIIGLRIQATETNLGTGSPSHKPVRVTVGGVEKFSVSANGLVSSGLAAVALGGGAAPTVGTIGGSGPASAAQAGWMKVSLAGGTYFIPVWQ